MIYIYIVSDDSDAIYQYIALLLGKTWQKSLIPACSVTFLFILLPFRKNNYSPYNAFTISHVHNGHCVLQMLSCCIRNVFNQKCFERRVQKGELFDV